MSYEVGQTTFANSAPLSIAEIRLYLYEIPYDSLSAVGQKEYRRIQDFLKQSYLGFASGLMSIGIDPSFHPSFFIKSNPDVEWIYDYTQREALFMMPLRITFADVVVIDADFFLGHNYWTTVKNDIYINIPLSFDSIDANVPQRSYISAGGSFFNFHLGMGELDIGQTQTGGILFSDTMIAASYAQLSFFSPRIRFVSTPIQLNINRYLYMHRLELRPFKWLSIGLIEGVLISQPFELRFLNPAMIFHSHAAWRDYTGSDGKPSGDSNAGSYWGLTVDIAPFKYTRIYAEFAMNQYQLPFEKHNWPEASLKIPDSIAFQGGIDWQYPLEIPHFPSGYIQAGLEAVYTSPWMYILAGKEWSFYRERFELIGPATGTPIRNWVGTPFGPDSIAVQAHIGYMVPAQWNIELRYLFWAKGENEQKVFEKIDAGVPHYPETAGEAQKQTPSGDPVYTHKLSACAEYTVNAYISAGVQGGFVWKYGKNPLQVSTELALYGTIYINPN